MWRTSLQTRTAACCWSNCSLQRNEAPQPFVDAHVKLMAAGHVSKIPRSIMSKLVYAGHAPRQPWRELNMFSSKNSRPYGSKPTERLQNFYGTLRAVSSIRFNIFKAADVLPLL